MNRPAPFGYPLVGLALLVASCRTDVVSPGTAQPGDANENSAMPADDSVVLEVTPEGEIVWQLQLKDTPAENTPGWFYKAQRICGE